MTKQSNRMKLDLSAFTGVAEHSPIRDIEKEISPGPVEKKEVLDPPSASAPTIVVNSQEDKKLEKKAKVIKNIPPSLPSVKALFVINIKNNNILKEINYEFSKKTTKINKSVIINKAIEVLAKVYKKYKPKSIEQLDATIENLLFPDEK